jgi:uncharacterized protein YktB (UPF0637 family)
MSNRSPEAASTPYIEALVRLEQNIWRICLDVAEEFDLSTNEVIALAITELHSRLIDVKEGRLLISVSAADARFYTSSLALHLAEADPVYEKVLEHLQFGRAADQPPEN